MDHSITHKPSAFMYALRSGLIIALIAGTFNTIGAMTDLIVKSYWGLTLFLVMGVSAFLFVKNYRKNLSGGYITFGKAFSICLQAILYAGIISVVYTFILEKYLFPVVLEHIQKINEQKLLDNKLLTDEQIEASIKTSRMMMNSPAFMIGVGSLMIGVMGTIISLIVAAICKKESNEFLPDE